MRVLFIVCAVLGTVGICGLLVMLLFFRLKINLGFRLPKGRTIPIEQFIPQGIYGYAVFTAVFGYFGLMLLQLSLRVLHSSRRYCYGLYCKLYRYALSFSCREKVL